MRRTFDNHVFERKNWKLPSFIASTKSVRLSIVDVLFVCVDVASNGQVLRLVVTSVLCDIRISLLCLL